MAGGRATSPLTSVNPLSSKRSSYLICIIRRRKCNFRAGAQLGTSSRLIAQDRWRVTLRSEHGRLHCYKFGGELRCSNCGGGGKQGIASIFKFDRDFIRCPDGAHPTFSTATPNVKRRL